MKTIFELKNEGILSTRTYIALVRGITYYGGVTVYHKFGSSRFADYPNANELTVKDIFDIWSDEDILRWRGLGQKSLNELKGLI